MMKFIAPIARLFSRVQQDEKGTQLVETAIWLGIIAATTVAAIVAMGPKVSAVMTSVSAALPVVAP